MMGFIATVGMLVMVSALYIIGQVFLTGSIFLVPYLKYVGGLDAFSIKWKDSPLKYSLMVVAVWMVGFMGLLFLSPLYTAVACFIVVWGFVFHTRELMAVVLASCVISGFVQLILLMLP